MTDECVGEQAAKGMQAYNKAREHEEKLLQMEQKYHEQKAIIKQQNEEMKVLKRCMLQLERGINKQAREEQGSTAPYSPMFLKKS